MPRAWRLAITILSGRPSRSWLLAAAVSLSVALVVAVSCAMATANRAIEVWIDANVGAGDLTARGAAGPQSLPESLLEPIDAWPETDLAVPRFEMDLAVQITRDVYESREDGSFGLTRRVLAATPQANGIVPRLEYAIRPLELIEGRLPEAEGEVVIDQPLSLWLMSPDRLAIPGAFRARG